MSATQRGVRSAFPNASFKPSYFTQLVPRRLMISSKLYCFMISYLVMNYEFRVMSSQFGTHNSELITYKVIVSFSGSSSDDPPAMNSNSPGSSFQTPSPW